MRASSPPLPPLEVPVRRGGAPLARREDVLVHAETHRAAWIAPLEAGLAEDAVETFRLGRGLHPLRARARPSPARRAPLGVPVRRPRPRADRSMRPLVHEPRKTRSTGSPSSGVPGRRSMYSSARRYDCRSRLGRRVRRIGHALGDLRRHARTGAPGDLRAQRRGIDDDRAVVAARPDRCASARQPLDRARPRLAPRRRAGATSRNSNVVSSGAIMPGSRARPRWTCCRPSSAPPSRARGSPRRCTPARGRCRRRSRSGGSARG